ncbi:hypothetical protein [Streptomyces otsuchiensis]|uniref:hypothetical protein n=1 Tax=Streptomyces otsuchiensis TaxID=2681388 RepID=UPI001030FA8A|nr:hypothetical protein [Streptomyces otsuchiensis]
MDIDVSSVPGYLYWWTLARARAAAGAATGVVDKAVEIAAGRLSVVVRERLGGDSALAGLDEEATDASVASAGPGTTEEEALTEDTRAALVYALKRAVRNDPDFAAQLADAITAVENADADRTVPGGVSSTGGGTTAGGDVTVTASGAGSAAVGGNAGDINLAPAPALAPAQTPETGGTSTAGQAPDPRTPGLRQS